MITMTLLVTGSPPQEGQGNACSTHAPLPARRLSGNHPKPNLNLQPNLNHEQVSMPLFYLMFVFVVGDIL